MTNKAKFASNKRRSVLSSKQGCRWRRRVQQLLLTPRRICILGSFLLVFVSSLRANIKPPPTRPSSFLKGGSPTPSYSSDSSSSSSPAMDDFVVEDYFVVQDAGVLDENEELLEFRDRSPRAPLHALIIPKTRHISGVFDLLPQDLVLLQQMERMALRSIQNMHPQAHANGDYRLVFHIPPFNSVDHLHLHVLAPLSEMHCIYREIKYRPNTRWCATFDQVTGRLRAGQRAVPYSRMPWIEKLKKCW